MQIKKQLIRCINLLYPPKCILCSCIADIRSNLCSACFFAIPIIKTACYRCAKPMPREGICGQCIQSPPYFDRAISATTYQWPIDKMLMQYKFNGKLCYANAFSCLLRQVIDQQDLPEVIMPVPLHKKRLRERGFNQSGEIAKKISKAINISFKQYYIYRQQETLPQSSLPIKKRQSNLHNAFAINKPIPYSHVAIVDDVMTSGATVNAMAKLIKQHTNCCVQVWSVARTVLT